ncbi:hypothetical protein SAMN04487886_100815 [Clostridium sp. DSM 8431]|uniref:hypothetical protein n=1 Tax=Clostridium sp. DSM 8431 TaxID=1761781 RepID=UPI0008E15915|nr:hypothetical protein [Clostridium sp. DSM 8431]SFU33050.1 hypothetical protein SAMN04487886_100815 [Clostridium sp. DSM 8431]
MLSTEELEVLKEKCTNINNMYEYNEAIEKIEEYKLHGVYIDDFVKRDDIFVRWRDCGINHMFIHIKIKDNGRVPGNLINQKLTSYDCDNSEEYYFSYLLEKCHEYNIKPCIKFMTDSSITIDYVKNNTDRFFFQFKGIIRYLFSCDSNKYIDMITLANETNIIRKFAQLKSYWKDVIDMIHTSYKGVKVSASQFCSDISTGEYDIADLLDIVGINRYPKNKNWPDSPSCEEILPYMYNDADIYHVQQFCKNNNKFFMISECGVSHWGGQCREPEMGNSMTNFYGKGYDYKMQAAYTKAAIIASKEMDYCVGHVIICGADYDPIFKFNYNNPITGVIADNSYGFEAIKSVWGEN